MLELRVSVEEHEIGPHAVWLEPHILAEESQWRAEPTMVVGAKDRTIAKLPCAVEDVALGGGRYLVAALPKVGKLAIIDVLDLHAMKFIALEESGPVRVAAGADKLLVLYTDKNILDRYSLTTLKKEAGIDLPFEGKIFSLAMGSASDGTLLAVGDKPLAGGALLVDVQKMRKLWLQWKGNNAAHAGEGAVAWASADGQVFGVGCANGLWRGFHTICLEEGAATIYSSEYVPSYACPGSNGRLVFTRSGLYTSHLQSPRNQPSLRGTPYLPAAQGDLFVKAGRDSLALFLEAEEEPLVKVTGLDLPDAGVKNQPLPFVKRIYVVPGANVIVTIPGGGEEVHYHRFAFAKALEHAKGDYLFVTAFAPPPCKRGHRFVYGLHAWSKKGGVTYQILSAPKGMAVSADGKVEWNVPQDAAEGVREVHLLVQDASARKVNHSFRVRVE